MEDDPFDFESDALLATSPVVAPKRRKKVLGLDDLVLDHLKEKDRVCERESKRAKTEKTYSSDDEEDDLVATLSKYVDECHEKMIQLSDEDDVSLWGLQVFGKQKPLPSFAFNDLSSCSLFRSCFNHEVNSLVGLSTESGETFFEGLLINRWLLTLVIKCSEVEKSIAEWTFHLMMYSSKEALTSAAVDFWCAILLLKKEGELPSIRIDWLPSYLEVKGALETYGFLLHSPIKDSSDTEMAPGDSECIRPPQNIRAWIKFVAACSQSRNTHSIFTTSEIEDLLVIIICLLLDRQLLGLSIELNECMLALVDSFTNNEWSISCINIAKSVASRVPKDINSVRAADCIPAVSGPTMLLRSATALHILLGYFDNVEDEEEVLRQLTSVNLKDKSCDLFKIYIYLALTENWFLYNPSLESKTWGVFLRNCYGQINISDSRPYASKVRSKASYLLSRR